MSEKPAKIGRLTDKRASTAPSSTPGTLVDPGTTGMGPEGTASTAGARRKSAREKIARVARSTGSVVKEAAVFVGDLNRDGKVNQEDASIATAKARTVASATAAGARKAGRKVLQHDMGKDAAAGAAIGAAVAVPIPIVGPVAGAAVGAIAGVIKSVRSRRK